MGYVEDAPASAEANSMSSLKSILLSAAVVEVVGTSS
jgi:hypothetical protein